MNRAVLFITVVLVALTGTETWAQEPAPVRDFSFRRVKVPGASSGKRITVQIDPAAPVLYQTPAHDPRVAFSALPASEPSQPTETGAYAWYWDLVSPDLADASPGRLEHVVNQLSNGAGGKSVTSPRLQHMQDIAGKYGRDILIATVGTDVSPALVLAVMGVESGGDPDALSSAGAQGLMQLIPATAERFGVKDSTDPVQNIRGGVAYLDWLMNEFERDPVFVLAAYNAGENAIKKNNGVPDYPETRDYVPKVLAAWKVAQGLCLTPPQLMSDGCVFAVQEARNNE